jgi:hypothetical protein
MSRIAVHVTGFNRRLIFGGALGTKILNEWTKAGAGARPVV